MKSVLALSLFALVGCSGPIEILTSVPYVSTSTSIHSLSKPITPTSKNIRNIILDNSEVIRLDGEVGLNVELLIEQLNRLNEEDHKAIWLIINSPGGSVIEGARLVSAVEASRTPVYTVCDGMCASMAALLHQYGKKRMMTDRSALMFHDASGALQGPLPQMQSRLNFFNTLVTKMDAYVAKKANISLDDFLIQIKSEIWLDSEDATLKGFNDELVYVYVKNAPVIPSLDSGTSRLSNFHD